MPKFFYTFGERTRRQYPMAVAIETAQLSLGQVQAVVDDRRQADIQMYTLAEINEIAQDIVRVTKSQRYH